MFSFLLRVVDFYLCKCIDLIPCGDILARLLFKYVDF